MHIAELQELSKATPPQPDGTTLRVIAVAASDWPTLPVDTCVILRLRGSKDLFAGFIVNNRLANFLAPALVLRQLVGKEEHSFKRRTIEELGRYELSGAESVSLQQS